MADLKLILSAKEEDHTNCSLHDQSIATGANKSSTDVHLALPKTNSNDSKKSLFVSPALQTDGPHPSTQTLYSSQVVHSQVEDLSSYTDKKLEDSSRTIISQIIVSGLSSDKSAFKAVSSSTISKQSAFQQVYLSKDSSLFMSETVTTPSEEKS